MKYGRDRAWLDVDLEKVRRNFQAIRGILTGSAEVMAVVKSNAYGLGAAAVAKAAGESGCRNFAVASIQEAAELRDAGIRGTILVLGQIPDEAVPYAVSNEIDTAVSSAEDAARQGLIAQRAGGVLNVQIAADSGMGRFGLTLDYGGMNRAVREAFQIASCPGVRVTGTFSHMTVMSEKKLREFDKHQIGLFRTFTERIQEGGLKVPRHCCCSAMTSLFPEAHMDMVRVGALPLGLQSPLYGTFSTQEVCSLRARIWLLKDVPRGATVGYGPHYTKRQTKLAIIPVGFGDGLHRSLSDCAPVLIRGRRATIFGKLCMDYSMVDVTDIPGVRVGDTVTLFGPSEEEEDSGNRGTDPDITVFEYAKLYGGTACEVTTSIGGRIPRFYLNE